MSITKRRKRRSVARECTVAVVIAASAMMGGGIASADGGEGRIVDTPATNAVPEKTYACMAAENAARDALAAADTKSVAVAKAAADATSAADAGAAVKAAADTQAAPEVQHAAAVQFAIASQVSDASETAAQAATEAQLLADVRLRDVADCQQAHGSPLPPVPVVPAVVPEVVPPGGTPAVVPGGVGTADIPVGGPVGTPSAGGQGGGVETPAADIVAGRNPIDVLRDATGMVGRWAMVGVWLILFASGVILAVGRRRDRVVPVGGKILPATKVTWAQVRRWFGSLRG